MRKDLMLLAALTGLVTAPMLQADPGGTATSIVAGERSPVQSSNVEETGQVNDRNASLNIGAPPAENLRRESPGSLGARGTIGQDGTGFTGQERIGTLPAVPPEVRKTNDFDKALNRHKDTATTVPAPVPFNPDSSGAPGVTQSGRASELDHAPNSAVELKPTQPVGTAGNAGRSPSAVGSATGETAETKAAPAVSNTSEDTQMSQRIRSQLIGPEARALTKLSASDVANVQISAATGVVTLSGTVPTPRAKQDLEAAVVHMRGVKSVDNHLTIKGADALTDNSPGAAK